MKSFGQGVNPGPPEYKTGVIFTWPSSWVKCTYNEERIFCFGNSVPPPVRIDHLLKYFSKFTGKIKTAFTPY
jgi:hypothetical protein